MSVIRLTATAGPDGVLRLSVPVGREGEFEVTVVATPKPTAGGAKPKTPEEPGCNSGYFENVIGPVEDETFVAPPRDSIKAIPPLDAE